jgi:urea carboxylase
MAMNETIAIAPGDTLKIGRFEGAGARAYLAVAGGIESPEYLGSCSTFTLGKFGGPFGRALLPGDVLGISSNGAWLNPPIISSIQRSISQ